MRIRHARTTVATATVLTCVLAVALAGCDERNAPGGHTPSSGAAVPAPTASVTDAAFAERRPGPRDPAESVVPADILVAGREALPAELVDRIRHLPGVAATTRISLANVSLENKVYNLAAVAPAQYRRFTPSTSADLQEQWNRVAGGEIAISPELRKLLPVDRGGYLNLFGDADETGTATRRAAARVHVGAWAPQVEQVDMVINEKRAAALGMTLHNALLISTGSRAPQDLRAPIDRALGAAAVKASVQNLDVIATRGLDPDAIQQAVFYGTFGDAIGTYNYRAIGGGRVAPDPAWVASHIVTEVVPILGPVTCNKYLFPQLKAALAEIVQLGLADKIHRDEYAGCYNARFIAGTTTLSNHSFGLALDLNVPGNQRGTVGQMDRGVVAVFKKWGFAWGGDWHYTDPMHFELASLARPGG